MTGAADGADLPALPAQAEVIVLGGGIAGLVVAWELSRAGRRVLLLEQRPELGGAVARHRVGGLDLDAGAESFAVTGGTVAALATELGLADRIVVPNPVGAWVFHDRGAAPLPARALLGIPAGPLAADVRRAVGPLAAGRAGLDRLLPARIGSGSATLGDLVRRRMGAGVLQRLVEPVAGGVYSRDPDELPLVSVPFPLVAMLREHGSLSAAVAVLRPGGNRAGSAVQGLTGGMFTLVEALRAAIDGAGGRIRTGVDIDAAERVAGGWQVRTAVGSVAADQVVGAVPLTAAAQLFGPQLALPAVVGPAPAGDIVLVTLVVDRPALGPAPRGTGVLVSGAAAGVVAKALTHATAKWTWLADRAGPGRAVLRLSYGRDGRGLPAPGTEIRQALADASLLLGVPLEEAHLVDTAVRRWPSRTMLAATLVTRLRADLPDRLTLVGSELAGVGLAAVVADARRTAAGLLSA